MEDGSTTELVKKSIARIEIYGDLMLMLNFGSSKDTVYIYDMNTGEETIIDEFEKDN